MQSIKKINFFIERKSLDKTVDRIYDLVREKHYLLKDSRKVFATKLHNFVAIMNTWGWSVSTDKSGNCVGIKYFGHEPLSHQKILFESIAPHIQPGSFIEFEIDEKNGEWDFDGEHMLMK